MVLVAVAAKPPWDGVPSVEGPESLEAAGKCLKRLKSPLVFLVLLQAVPSRLFRLLPARLLSTLDGGSVANGVDGVVCGEEVARPSVSQPEEWVL